MALYYTQAENSPDITSRLEYTKKVGYSEMDLKEIPPETITCHSPGNPVA